jgi:hypothetical protein
MHDVLVDVSPMQGESLKAAERAYLKASRAAYDLSMAKTHDEAEDAWERFLGQHSRVYEKLRAGAKGSKKSEQWFFGTVQPERKNDELLAYLHHARNADTHGLADVTARDDPGAQLLFIGPDGHQRGGWIKSIAFGPNGVEADWSSDDPTAKLVVQRTAPLVLHDVKDSGVVYKVPTQHLGRQLDHKTPVEVAQLGASYLERMLATAPPAGA